MRECPSGKRHHARQDRQRRQLKFQTVHRRKIRREQTDWTEWICYDCVTQCDFFSAGFPAERRAKATKVRKSPATAAEIKWNRGTKMLVFTHGFCRVE